MKRFYHEFENLRIIIYVNFWEFETMLLASNYIRYGGEEYEEATYGRGGKNSYIICPLLILPLLLSSVDI